MDMLSDVLRVVRLSGAVFFSAEFSSPWAIESPNAELLASFVLPRAKCVVLFHILTEGECFIFCNTHPAVKMKAGDVIRSVNERPIASQADLTAATSGLHAGAGVRLGYVDISGKSRTAHLVLGKGPAG